MPDTIELNVNGASHHIDTAPTRTLLDVLREDLGLTGCKPGCGEGACGACTVLVDRQPTRACVTAIADVAGRQILTIEGLAGLTKQGDKETRRSNDTGDGESEPQLTTPSSQPPSLHPLQQAFLDLDAMQCGYCTPGMIMAALGLLLQQPNPTEQAIVQAMNGNICRCGAYSRIVGAIRQAATALRGEA